MNVPASPRPACVLTILARAYDHPHARDLVDQLHADQIARYGFADHPASNAPADFEAPQGLFLVGYHDQQAVACGGYRLLPEHEGVVELKRMFVQLEHRRRGYGRLLLNALEASARQHGARRAVLETGARNNQALALYTNAGYRLIPGYVGGRNPDVNRALAKNLID